MTYYAYEHFDPDSGYCLCIHRERETFDEHFNRNVDYLHHHHRTGTVKADSVQQAIQFIADDVWSYKEYNNED